METKRDQRIDTLKAASICLIVIWHVQPFKFVTMSSDNIYQLLSAANSFFLYEITLIAVPCFFFSSIFLFGDRLNETGPSCFSYFRKRLFRLSYLYIFWVSVQSIIYLIVNGEVPILSLSLVASGGPPLPIVGGSVFYFIFDLLCLSIFAFLFTKSPIRARGIISAIVFVASFLLFQATIAFPKLKLGHENLANFLYLIPLVYTFGQNRGFFFKHKYKLLTLYGLFVLQDVFAHEYLNCDWPLYGRVSIALGTLTFWVFLMSSAIGQRQIPYIISKYSLGIFALHKYFQFLTYKFLPPEEYVSLYLIGIDIHLILVFLFTCFLTTACLYLVGRTGLVRFVT